MKLLATTPGAQARLSYLCCSEDAVRARCGARNKKRVVPWPVRLRPLTY